MSKEQPFQYDEQLENARKHIEQHAIWRNEELEAFRFSQGPIDQQNSPDRTIGVTDNAHKLTDIDVAVSRAMRHGNYDFIDHELTFAFQYKSPEDRLIIANVLLYKSTREDTPPAARPYYKYAYDYTMILG